MRANVVVCLFVVVMVVFGLTGIYHVLDNVVSSHVVAAMYSTVR